METCSSIRKPSCRYDPSSSGTSWFTRPAIGQLTNRIVAPALAAVKQANSRGSSDHPVPLMFRTRVRDGATTRPASRTPPGEGRPWGRIRAVRHADELHQLFQWLRMSPRRESARPSLPEIAPVWIETVPAAVSSARIGLLGTVLRRLS